MTRRAVLTAGVVGAAAVATPVVTPGSPLLPAATATTGMVTPLSAQAVHNAYGVSAHPTDKASAYQHVTAWLERLKEMGARGIRGGYVPGNPVCDRTAIECRRLGLKWLMIPANSGTIDGHVKWRIDHIATHNADICWGIEGINEPTTLDQAAHTQSVIWDRVRSHSDLDGIPVVGPSLLAYFVERRQGADYSALKEAGILNWQDMAGMHHYPGGRVPDYGLDAAVRYLHNAYGEGYPIWWTETGYTNALAATSGQVPVPEAVSATYGPRTVLEAARRGLRVTRYETLDARDRGAKDHVQRNFGLWRVRSADGAPWRDWTAKPEAAALKWLLTRLDDPGPAYHPAPRRLSVHVGTTDVRWVCTARRDGTCRLWFYRPISVWDRVHRRELPDRKVTVKYTDAAGTHSVTVGAKVVRAVVA